ncbi:MAG: hypothetical protein E6R12_10415 [Sphingomonadales bacterium]|nr:MAG: hypothetical protein E6R12_10415 [Sphingomonadales bacterium]
MSQEYFDILMVVPLEEELLEVMEVFPSVEDRSDDTTFCHVVDTGNADISMVVMQQQRMGKTGAITAASALLSKYDASLIVCLGIAGSLSDDLHLGDVCYSGTIIDVLDNAKVIDCANDAIDTELSPSFYDTPMQFTAAINFIRTQPNLRPKYQAWQSARSKAAAELLPGLVPAPGGGDEQLGEPKTKNGAIVCGAVSRSELYNKKLRAIDRALLAVETESGGVFAQAKQSHDTPALTIRGISDHADKDKGKLERQSQGGVRKLAAANAATFLKLQIENPSFLKALDRRKAGRQTELALLDKPEAAPALHDVLLQLSGEIDETLRKLSPEYKLQPKGYRLPLPRIRQASRVDGTDDASIGEPVDVRLAIEQHDRILISLPRTYPDQSLAWVVADDLITTDVSGKQAVPVVIDGEAVRGKRSTFDTIASVDLSALSAAEGVQLVFIIENVPFSSKHRLETIRDELPKYPGAKFVFIARGDAELITSSDFISSAAATPYDLCAISFFEIAHFIQKNFEMTGSEAEVVALRLRDTFNRFDLDAHPTYFAGIPKETLSALLQANRRSELIQLAVDGFLTFLVAGDRSDVALSRSTRARFLRKLVVEMKVEKRSFAQADLIAFTREFADRHDFDIDPLAFIQGFVDQGIMHFESDRVHISLPFIESYLLASELAADPAKADAYFDLNDILFDMVTFDLYAEIGASPQLIQRVSAALADSIQVLQNKNSGEHILLTESIAPANIKRPERADVLRKRLRNAAEAVRDGVDKSSEKQKLLDLTEKIREATGKQRKIRGHVEGDDAPDDELKALSDACRQWAVATVLLGSGAEHLEADTKRNLSAMLVRGAVRIIDDWSRAQQELDFDSLKRELTTDETLAKLPGPDNLEDKRRFVIALIDILEYAAMADPLRQVVGFLCEQARHRVLAPSVEKAESDGLIDKVVHGTWLADIDTARGRQPLREAIRAPKSDLLPHHPSLALPRPRLLEPLAERGSPDASRSGRRGHSAAGGSP